jgi:hypothetical protein
MILAESSHRKGGLAGLGSLTWLSRNLEHKRVRNTAKLLQSDKFPSASSIARQRGFVRTALKAQMKEIDNLVVVLLKGQAVGV